MRFSRGVQATCALSLLVLGVANARKQDPPKTPQLIPAPIRIQPGTLRPAPPLWGFADLHTHPASHLGFGDRGGGGIMGGMFWGKPGMGLASSMATLNSDMPPCAVDSHYGEETSDAVRKETRKEIIKTIDGIHGSPHGPNGAPSFRDWPHSQSLLHQQMHISGIKRAYDGGLRLMVASVTDAQILSNMWTKVGTNLDVFHNNVPPVDKEFDIKSAHKQLAFIQKLVFANISWMRIVTSAAEARRAIADNKLAVILALEMDTLTPEQVMTLVSRYKVRLVTPVHLTNGHFGGTAVYSDAFNASNNYVNGSFYKVTTDPKLKFRLGKPSYLETDHGKFGAVVPRTISDDQYKAIGYTQGADARPTPYGHKNVEGLNKAAFERLMRAGLLLDVAHMSQQSMSDALFLAERYKYPVMNSHTGLRGMDEYGHSERDMMRAHARRLTALGGVIGYGMERTNADRPGVVGKWLRGYLEARAAIGGRQPMAFGTDMNGFAAQIPGGGGDTVVYPIRVASRAGTRPAGFTPPALPQSRLGARTFNFSADGLAHFGMLPDFMQSLIGKPNYQEALDSLYSSADAVVRMWEGVEAARARMGSGVIVTPPP